MNGKKLLQVKEQEEEEDYSQIIIITHTRVAEKSSEWDLTLQTSNVKSISLSSRPPLSQVMLQHNFFFIFYETIYSPEVDHIHRMLYQCRSCEIRAELLTMAFCGAVAAASVQVCMIISEDVVFHTLLKCDLDGSTSSTAQ